MRRRFAVIVAVVIAGAALSLPAYISARAFWFERENYVRSPAHPLLERAEATGISGLRTVSFPSGGRKVAGWFARGSNGATTVLVHGTNADRVSLLWETRVLAQAGFGVLAFDWPGYGASEGRSDWGIEARQALTAALDWLQNDEHVDPTRVGAFGFSSGGHVLAQVARRDMRIRSVVLAATPTDLFDEARWEYRRHGALSVLPALWAVSLFGERPVDEPAVMAVSRIAPRPVLVIGGTDDQTVPPWMVEAMYAAAAGPKKLWMVRGARHGHYSDIAPERYAETLVGFFRTTLKE